MILGVVIAIMQAGAASEVPEWSKAAVVQQGRQPVVRFQARIDGDYLFVRAIHENEWHTYAIDNESRAKKALSGKMSLGIEQGLEITVKRGLELDRDWKQTPPLDLSKPELRWYTYGFDQTALFACRIRKITTEPIVLRIRGQACSGETCCRIDVIIELEQHENLDDTTPEQRERVKSMLKDLVPVATRSDAAADVRED